MTASSTCPTSTTVAQHIMPLRPRPLTIDVSVVIGKQPQLVVDCLESFLACVSATYDIRITVTCNWETTDVTDMLRARFDTRNWRFVKNPVPRSFAANHNDVLEVSTADYVFILNDDLVFLPDSVEKLVAFMERPENRRVAMLSPRLLNPDGTLQPSTYGFPSVLTAFIATSGLRQLIPFSGVTRWLANWLGRGAGRSRFWAHDQTVDVDTLRGACILARTEAVRAVGLMCQLSRAGGEETEWHYRFHKDGWRVVYFPEAQVVHYGSQTLKTDISLRNENLKSSLYIFRTHHTLPEFFMFSILTLVALWIRAVGNALTLRKSWARVDLNGAHIIVQALLSSIIS